MAIYSYLSIITKINSCYYVVYPSVQFVTDKSANLSTAASANVKTRSSLKSASHAAHSLSLATTHVDLTDREKLRHWPVKSVSQPRWLKVCSQFEAQLTQYGGYMLTRYRTRLIQIQQRLFQVPEQHPVSNEIYTMSINHAKTILQICLYVICYDYFIEWRCMTTFCLIQAGQITVWAAA